MNSHDSEQTRRASGGPNPEIERYLVESTSGLSGDRELQLDVQAELQSHIDERVDELVEAGRPADEADAEALRAMGDLTELAPALLEGNARRLSVRARARQLVRFALPVAALLVLLLCRDLAPYQAVDVLRMLNGFAAGEEWGGGTSPSETRFTEQERLILYGDRDRPVGEQQRALWESEPDSPVYYGNHILDLASHYEEIGPTPEARLATLERELEHAEGLDPDNALYGLLLAAKMLDMAVDVDDEGTGMAVKNEAQLTAGLAELERALALPEMRRPQIAMAGERLRILGPPERMGELMERLATLVGIKLPEITDFRQLARIAGLAGERVAKRDGLDAARPLQEIGERLAKELNDGAFSLVEMLVVAAIVKESGERAARVHEAYGDAETATAIRARTERLLAPKARWDAEREDPKNGDGEFAMKYASSSLVHTLMPAIGAFPPRESYRPLRMLDYTVAEQILTCFILLFAFIITIGCALVALRRRFGARGDAIPILLLPSARFSLNVLAIALVVPLALRLLYLNLPLVGARDWFAFLMPQRLGIEGLLFGLSMLVLISLLIRDFVRRRCCELRIEAPAPAPAWHRKALIGMALVGAGSLMVPVPYLPHAAGGPAKVAMALLLLGLLLAACVAFWRGMFGDAKLGLYYGSFARSALPFFCAAIIIIGALARPLLLQREARLLANDTLMPTQTDGPGLSSTIEQNLAERLRDEFAAALSAERNP